MPAGSIPLDLEELLAPASSGEAWKDAFLDVNRQVVDLLPPDYQDDVQAARQVPWAKIEEKLHDTLATRVKHLFLVCRFIEALIYRYGYQGLREGMKAFVGFV